MEGINNSSEEKPHFFSVQWNTPIFVQKETTKYSKRLLISVFLIWKNDYDIRGFPQTLYIFVIFEPQLVFSSYPQSMKKQTVDIIVCTR